MATDNLKDFFARCDSAHRELFSSVLHDWSEMGLPRLWEDGEAALCVHTSGRNVPLFILVPFDSSRQACLRLPLDSMRSVLGEIEVQRLVQTTRAIHGLRSRRRNGYVELADPGHASGIIQQTLRDLIRGLAVRLSSMLAP